MGSFFGRSFWVFIVDGRCAQSPFSVRKGGERNIQVIIPRVEICVFRYIEKNIQKP